MEVVHGFHPGCSTITYNLVLKNYVYQSFNLKSQVNVIYTDFNKEFDSGNHNLQCPSPGPQCIWNW